jgi:hypothetical protein
VWIAIAWWQTHKALPAGTHVASPVCAASVQELRFIADIAAADSFGRAVVTQGIFDEVLRVLRSRCSCTSTRYGTTARRLASSTPRISRFSPILRSRTTGSPG